MQICRFTYTYHFSFSKCQRHYFAGISTHAELVWHIQDSPELPCKYRSSERCMFSRSAHMEWVWHIHLSAICVLEVQHRSNWQNPTENLSKPDGKQPDVLTCWRETGIWKRNKNLKTPQRDEDLLLSKRRFWMFLLIGE